MWERSSLPTVSTWVPACSERMRRKFSWPARFSAIHSRAKSPDWISLRMRFSISNTAEYGDYTRGKRVITDETRANMRKILDEIQSGDFAREWIAENRAGQENFQRMRAEQAGTEVETVGKELRSHMDWIKTDF